ncbi:MAG: hypothetical protein M3R36_04820 [Bacteroidota bacterium]|nr:hypothetical protein [Bacteroidota bacterium]
MNGDGFVDVADASIADNNVFNFVSKIVPPGAGSQGPRDNLNTKVKNQNEQKE